MKWIVPETQKLIHFLQKELQPAPSGKMLRRVLEANLCRVNGTVERFGTADVAKGSVVELSPAWATVATPNLNHFEILYEDDHLIVANKPVGWVCTDEECIRSFGAKRYLVHRLDKETTGALLIAKNIESREGIIHLFKERAVEKIYYALVDRVPAAERGRLKGFFGKVGMFQGQTRWGTRPKGLYAETHWKRIVYGENASLLACQPVTGRTHQIRVHLSEMGHPILVDRQYSATYTCKYFAKRPLLHAARIRFIHPMTGVQIDVTAPLAADFVEALETLGLLKRLDRAFFQVAMREGCDLLAKEEEDDSRDRRQGHKNSEEVEESADALHESCQ
jgi:23S rRNA pseudouridine955/2504/2580 synthase/23S rRNA pseudouridine1911/1915/1917 synthase